ncbi:unnamed protein product [Soboliphyme baturini]|uniref:PRMT5 domain-containing protein n=1 Tax=Soboliphyme baturini TaxID=241478 RepID=A0A183J2Y5_9BILA|nr:unnamed protein product [Soboliphyme baturini]
MVLGAGRGPLVTVCLESADVLNCKINMFAIEKNPCAIITLNSLNETKWDNRVTVVCSDMRDFYPGIKADIIVSELLGSFGDNELSPECLDGALHLFKGQFLTFY